MSRLVLRIAVGILVVLIASALIVEWGTSRMRRSFETSLLW